MKAIILSLLFLGSVAVAQAQTVPVANTGDKVAFNQAGPSLAEVAAYTYKAYVDTATVGAPISVTCTGTVSPFTCQTVIAATLPTGQHTVRLSAANAGGESLPSTPFTFSFNITILAPATPANLRIVH